MTSDGHRDRDADSDEHPHLIKRAQRVNRLEDIARFYKTIKQKESWKCQFLLNSLHSN